MATTSLGENERFNGGHITDTSLAIATAHELSSPLVLLRQLSLAVSLTDISDETRRLLGEQLTLTSERALRMATSLSMVASQQHQFELEPINPVSICQEVVRELTPLFNAHGQTLTLQSRTRTPLLVGNRSILEQILMSFGDNALLYGSESHPVRMSISGKGDSVRIGVRDYGPAVPIDIWRRIEERISRQAPTPLASRPHVSSVGLVAAKRLAEVMGSAVGVTRHRDGATFYVDLRVSGQMSLL